MVYYTEFIMKKGYDRRTLLKKGAWFLYFTSAFFAFSLKDVQAYIDPSIMTYMIQALAGAAIALGTLSGFFWQKIRKLFFSEDVRFQNMEPDQIEFLDPKDQKIRRIDHPVPVHSKSSAGIKDDVPAILLSIAFGFMLGIYFPLEIYFTNIHEFQYDVYSIFGWILLLGVIITGCLMLFYLLLHRISPKLFQIFLFLGVIILICFFIQGTFLSGNLPPSDGSPADWNAYGMENVKSIVLWLVVTVFCVLFWNWLKKPGILFLASASSVVISVILVISLVFSALGNNGFQHKTELCISHDGLDQMSENRNFVIFVVDAVDSRTFQDLMNTTDPDFADVFRDFTYYPDTLGAYGFTTLAIPQLLTGEWFECQDEFRSYFTEAMKTSPLLNRLKQEHYTGGIYDVQDVVFEDPEFFEYENIDHRPYGLGSPVKFMMDELRMDWFLCMPFPLKKLQPYALFNLQNEEAADYFYQWYDPWINSYFQNHSIQGTSDKKFRFIHIEGAHPPLRYDKDLNDVEDTDEASYENNVRACITTLNTYLSDLRSSGTYDSAAIVILADHGYADHVHSESRQNPLLLVKGIGESHDFAVSDVPVSYNDLPVLYQNLLDLKTGEEAMPSSKGKPRRFIQYEYDNLNLLTEMILENATADQSDALKATGKVFSR